MQTLPRRWHFPITFKLHLSSTWNEFNFFLCTQTASRFERIFDEETIEEALERMFNSRTMRLNVPGQGENLKIRICLEAEKSFSGKSGICVNLPWSSAFFLFKSFNFSQPSIYKKQRGKRRGKYRMTVNWLQPLEKATRLDNGDEKFLSTLHLTESFHSPTVSFWKHSQGSDEKLLISICFRCWQCTCQEASFQVLQAEKNLFQ